VTIDHAVADVLARLGDGQVEALADACAARTHATSSVAATALGAAPGGQDAVAVLVAAWRDEQSLTGAGVALALRVGLAARRASAAHRAQPVWTGPGAQGAERLTAGVLHELVAGARERVLLVSYAAFTLPALAKDLSGAVERGCAVDVLFETTEDSTGAYDGHGVPFSQVAGIRRWRWPAIARPAGAALHAKVLVIDGQRALIGSANLTHRALTSNLEAGILIRDPAVAGALEQHVRQLRSAGVLLETT